MQESAPNNLAGYRTILLFGGSFDPPHHAHIALPQQAAKAIGADVIAYIPAGRAPHKLDKVQTASQHRLAMLRLALADADAHNGVPSTVLTDEIDRGPELPSYTVATLEALSKRIAPGTKLRLLIGADQLRIFDTWRDYERIIALAEPVVMVRPPDTKASLLGSLSETQRAEWADRLIEIDVMDVSSTQVRSRIASGQSTDDLICAAVAKYIAAQRLYQ